MLAQLKDIAYLVHRGARSLQPPKPNWGDLIAEDTELWKQARQQTAAPKVLIATSTGRHKALASLESMLGVALTLRGATVEFLLCDQVLPACQEATIQQTSLSTFIQRGPQSSLCDSCLRNGKKALAVPDLPIHYYSRWITSEEIQTARHLAQTLKHDEIVTYKLKDYAVGEHALAGTLRYFAKGTLDTDPQSEAVLRRYFEAALYTVYAIERLLIKKGYDIVCFHHGIYVPQGIIGEVSRQLGKRVVNWTPSYRSKTFIFSHGDTYHHTLMDEPTATWENIAWNPALEAETMKYLKNRWYGKQDWIWFHDQPEFDLEQIKQELGFDFSRPAIGMLTNVMWDAQLHYPVNAFENMLDWVIKTIDYFKTRPDLQLIIRIHPAELRGTLTSRQLLADEIHAHYESLPPNITIIPPESQISTYVVMQHCDSAIIYGTKTGVELTSMGIPVIVAGEAWIRNKGLTVDAHSQAEYYDILSRLPFGERLSAEQTERAQKYAFHFFFRRMIPLDFTHPLKGMPPFELHIDSLKALLPRQNDALDTICDGILHGTDFVYQAENLIG